MAAIAHWISLRLQSCGPGFESQAHHICFNIVKFCTLIVVLRKGQNVTKRAFPAIRF